VNPDLTLRGERGVAELGGHGFSWFGTPLTKYGMTPMVFIFFIILILILPTIFKLSRDHWMTDVTRQGVALAVALSLSLSLS